MKKHFCKVNPSNVSIGNFKIKINENAYNNSNHINILEELVLLRNDTSLSKDEKDARIKKLLETMLI